MRTLLLLSILFGVFSCENPETETNKELPSISFLRRNLDTVDRQFIYVNDGSSNDLFYQYSEVENPKGALLLFPPTAETVELTLENNRELASLLKQKGIALIVPSINFNLYLNDFNLNFINEVIASSRKELGIPTDKFVVGGFSLGGMNAIRFTELAYENNSLTAIQPQAVYGIDPPLDFERLYRAFERTVARNFSEGAVQEAEMYLQKVNQQFGGSPDSLREMYVQHSMYSHSAEKGGNAQYLKNVSIRIYSDPDIDWNLKQRQNDLYGMNALDQTAMINQLQLMGNKKAEYINALGKGFRLNGKRHPHSWNIAEPEDLLVWIDGVLE